MTLQLNATFQAWRRRKGAALIWLDEETFHALPRERRAALVRTQVRLRRGAVPTVRRWSDLLDGAALRAQADGHRFVWWPSMVDKRVLDRVAATSPSGAEPALPPSRHAEVATWPKLVPGARRLAGTFASGAGSNCFGNVMGAAGVPNAAEEWMQIEPFERWLAATCRKGGTDAEPGTVLVWRDNDGRSAHAAITLGDGWAFQKPSFDWWAARVVLDVEDLKRGNRTRGWRLEHHRIIT
jgi:hypothetical protein